MKQKFKTYFSDIFNRYCRARKKDQLLSLFLVFLISNLLFFIVFYFLESIWYLSPTFKCVLWYLLFLNCYFVFQLIRILSANTKNKKERESVYLTIGNKYSNVKDRLLNHVQLAENPNEISILTIESFMATNPVETFKDAYSPRSKKKKIKVMALLMLGLVILMILSPATLERIFYPRTQFEPDFDCNVLFSIPDTSIYSYDSLSFEIVKTNAEKFMLELYELDIASNQTSLLLRSRDSLIRYNNDRLNSSKQYRVMLLRPNIFYPRSYLASDTLNIKVLQRPKIKTVDIRVQSPDYTQIPEAFYQGNIDKINCLYGAKIYIDVLLSEIPGTAFLIYENDSLKMDVLSQHCSFVFNANRDANVSIYVENKFGIQTETIPQYMINVTKDADPSLQVLTPKKGEEYLLNKEMNLPYITQLQDDFGLSRFELEYSVHSDFSFESDTIIYKKKLELDTKSRIQTRAGIWEIEQFISPGSEIRYSFLVYDNDMISGPKFTRSNLFYAKLPTLTELFENNNEKTEENIAILEEKVESIEDIAEDIEKVRKELLQEGHLDWENKSKLEENLSMLEEGQKDLQELEKAMQDQKKSMDENNMFSDKVMEDFQQLQELMNELIDDELFDIMQEIQEKLKSNDDSNMEKIMENFSEKAKKFEESLDRMLEIFKQIQQEQRLEELNERIKASLEEQNNILEKAGERSTDELGEQEKKIAEETKAWEELADESKNLFSDEDQKTYEEFLASMEEEAVSDMMQKASESFSQNDKQGGQKQSQSAKNKLTKLSGAFSSMSSKMMEKQKDQIEDAFRKAFLQCMYMSAEQEKIKSLYFGLSSASPLIHAFTSSENDMLVLANELNRDLFELSKKTFLIDNILGQQLGAVISNLKSGIQQVEEAKLSNGQTYFSNAFKSMNELGRLLLERMTMVRNQQEGNASGMDFYMKQLQQMAEQQKQMNQGMQQMGMNGTPSQSMMDQMAQMAGRQQALRRSLKGLQQSLADEGGSKRMMGDLGSIAKNMEDVINQMRQNKVSRETIVRQEKILQRLLDASRSATSRDYKKDRQSKSGQTLERKNPLSLPSDLGDHENLINEIRRELRETKLSPKEKREMENYLESLLDESRFREVEK